MSGHKANPSHFKHLNLGQGLNFAVDPKQKMWIAKGKDPRIKMLR
jgi:hypothetical protein